MRHRKNRKHFNRTGSHRKAMFQNMAVSLLKHEMIKTTVNKAKELRRVVERLITLGKKDTVANRRLAFSRLRDKVAVGKLFKEIGPRFNTRPGGYTRVLKCGFRAGDRAPMAYIELVERGEIKVAPPKFEAKSVAPPALPASADMPTEGADITEETPEQAPAEDK